MAWIESHDELPTHPKTAKLARRLGVSKPATVGHLHFLWWWCLTHRPDGVLHDMDADDIADAAGWDADPDQFVTALDAAGWLDYDHDVGDYFVHDWWEHAGQTIARRQKATVEQRESGRVGAHRRWCVKEGRPIPNCTLCPTDVGSGKGADGPPNGVPNGVPMGSDGYRDRDRDKKVKPVVSRKRATNATTLPDGWTPEPEPDLIRSVGGDVAARRELAKFRDYWVAQPGARGRKKDWQATWRNWLRNAEQYGARASPQEDRRGSSPVVGSDEWAAREEEQAELERRVLGDQG